VAGVSRPPSLRVHYMLATARALLAQGGAARPMRVYAWLEAQGLRREQTPPAGIDADSHYQREVRFARQELADSGILVSSDGAWKVADAEAARRLTAEEARKIIGDNRRRREARKTGTAASLSSAPPRPLPNVADGGPTRGPAPAAWEGTVAREPGPASTYAFRFGQSDLWKIGFAADVDNRLRQINQHVPTELLGEGWTAHKRQFWPDADLAYAMEQHVLGRLREHSTKFERVRCSAAVLDAAWDDAFDELHRAKAGSLAEMPGSAAR